MTKISLRKREAFTGFSFILPALILLLLFGFIPVFIAGDISLFRFPLVNPAKRVFIGLDNYSRALSDDVLRKAMINTAYYALWQVPMQTGLALVLALLVKKSFSGISIFRIGYYLPVVIPMVVASVLWRIMLDSHNGLVNSILKAIGLSAQPLLSSPTQALPVLAGALSWKWVGFAMLIFLAGLQDIPYSYYEAATVDGANWLQSFWYITLPLLRRPAVYVIVTNTINALKLFTPIYIITKGGPQNSTITMMYYIFREAFTYGHLGYASAIAVIFTFILIIFAALQLRILRSDEE
jgi:fructooligosaccharide transport system permease protein